MTTKQYNLLELLDYIDPAQLNYQDWVNVGMALKDAGYMAADWDRWSSRDRGRYHTNECFRKWDGFKGAPMPVTAGTIVQMARDQGWQPERAESHELSWDDEIGAKEDYVVINQGWLEGREVAEPGTWNPVEHLIKYLETLFEAGENVGYVTESWEKDGKYLPAKGAFDRTAGQLIQELHKCDGDIGKVFGDYKPEVGAWIRFNPLDGKGVKNENVTEFRYALVESDSMDLDKQNAIIRELELPVACLVHSGKKSIHAIVRVDAGNYDELKADLAYILRQRYYEDRTLQDIGNERECTRERVRQIEREALKRIRKSKAYDRLKPYRLELLTACHVHVGAREYKRTWCSAVEKATFRREEIRNREVIRQAEDLIRGMSDEDLQRLIQVFPHLRDTIIRTRQNTD